ncbi:MULTISPECIES: DUF6328 family protein [Streptomyces]|uniref:Uncharacterized protein n=1 Tax=Streptomyces stelliscabiei TaxID=146820 RepID=A0A8I0P345_9ACTN|nr:MULTISPECIES: DUF6328 family protein [Streptomyces]KND42175.1 hypothetical protein IQ64_25055 [Streptomyces stelliscabiei]MBE1595396.1 hypothetical protein [Streptomyces stelliscabiei]MDX2517354.1 DUF6328 family protein [Streptomyces stelliscabiei]MDX2554566.1 DUF6328 family protein [Streptomyces stelliscabiei]MDX2613094.1 DUF6328 family protein [Streptomyces stelliscabiei]
MAEQPTRPARNETPLERADRNFSELLQELRVTQTGVQILFAFLLTLAFTPRFSDLDTFQRVTYVTTLLLAVLAATLFTAPAALHRSLFQQNAKPAIVRVSSRLATAGLIVLMPAFTGSVLLVVDVTLSRTAGIAAGSGTLLACLLLWGLLPKLVGRASGRDTTPPSPLPPPAPLPPPSPPVEDDSPVRSPADHLR